MCFQQRLGCGVRPLALSVCLCVLRSWGPDRAVPFTTCMTFSTLCLHFQMMWHRFLRLFFYMKFSFLMIHFLYFVSKKLLTLMVLHLLLIITSKTPAGVICPGRMNTGRLPQLPIQFSYRVEVISEIVNFVTTYDVSEYNSLKLNLITTAICKLLYHMHVYRSILLLNLYCSFRFVFYNLNAVMFDGLFILKWL